MDRLIPLEFNPEFENHEILSSRESLPPKTIINKSKKSAIFYLSAGILLAIAVSIFLFITHPSPLLPISAVIYLFSIALIGVGIKYIISKKTIILTDDFLVINNELIEWKNVDKPLKKMKAGYKQVLFTFLILQLNNGETKEVLLNYLDHTTDEIEQLVYLYWAKN